MTNEKQEAPRPEGPERSEGPSGRGRRPDPEVLAKGRRRQFSGEYKLKILEAADACKEPGAIAALLRREGLYSSHLTSWRKARRSGALGALKKRRGPKGRRRDPVATENEKLRKENARLKQRLAQAEVILEIQKKASEILGIPLKPHTFDEDA
jgi:transposase